MDITFNMTLDCDVIDPPTAYVSILAGQSHSVDEIWSDSHGISFTQGDPPIVWPHLHYVEIDSLDEDILFDALRDSVTIVAVGQAV